MAIPIPNSTNFCFHSRGIFKSSFRSLPIKSGRAHTTQHSTHCGLWLQLQSWLMPQSSRRLRNDLKMCRVGHETNPIHSLPWKLLHLVVRIWNVGPNHTQRAQIAHYIALEFTPIVCSWSITDTDSVLCTSEDCYCRKIYAKICHKIISRHHNFCFKMILWHILG